MVPARKDTTNDNHHNRDTHDTHDDQKTNDTRYTHDSRIARNLHNDHTRNHNPARMGAGAVRGRRDLPRPAGGGAGRGARDRERERPRTGGRRPVGGAAPAGYAVQRSVEPVN